MKAVCARYGLGRRKDALLTRREGEFGEHAGWERDGYASSTELIDLHDQRVIGHADIECAHIAVGRNGSSANHRIVDRNVAKRRTEIDGYGISGAAISVSLVGS